MRRRFFLMFSRELVFDHSGVASTAVRHYVVLHNRLVDRELLFSVVTALADDFGSLALTHKSADYHAIVKPLFGVSHYGRACWLPMFPDFVLVKAN